MTEEPRSRVEAAAAHVGDLIQELDPGAFATRFVALVEILDTEGDKGLWCFTHAGAAGWETLGLLDFGRAMEAAKVTRAELSDDDA